MQKVKDFAILNVFQKVFWLFLLHQMHFCALIEIKFRHEEISRKTSQRLIQRYLTWVKLYQKILLYAILFDNRYDNLTEWVAKNSACFLIMKTIMISNLIYFFSNKVFLCFLKYTRLHRMFFIVIKQRRKYSTVTYS